MARVARVGREQRTSEVRAVLLKIGVIDIHLEVISLVKLPMTSSSMYIEGNNTIPPEVTQNLVRYSCLVCHQLSLLYLTYTSNNKA